MGLACCAGVGAEPRARVWRTWLRLARFALATLLYLGLSGTAEAQTAAPSEGRTWYQSPNVGLWYAPPGQQAASPEPGQAHAEEAESAEVPAEATPLAPPTFQTGPLQWTPVGKVASTPLYVANHYTLERPIASIFARALAGLEVDSKWLRFFVNLEAASEFGPHPVAGRNTLDPALFELWLDVHYEDFYLRVGRQELSLGSRRLISPSGAPNIGRYFDGVRAHGKHGRFSYDLFGGYETILDPARQGIDAANLLATLYTRFDLGKTHGIEPNVLFRHVTAREPAEDASIGRPGRNITNLGLRAVGDEGGFHYDVEGNFQLGRVGELPHRAFALVGELDYAFDVKLMPTLGGGVSWASGNSPDGTWSAFDTFYPFNLPLYGAVSLFSLSNLIDVHARVRISPFDPRFSLTFTAFMLGLAESSDTWVDAFGLRVGQVDENTSPIMGFEYDLVAQWVPRSYLYFNLAYGIFVPSQAATLFDRFAPSHTVFGTAVVRFGSLSH